MKFLRLKVFFVMVLVSLIWKPCVAQISIPVSDRLAGEDKTWYINNVLDSMMNKRRFNTGAIICVNENSITIDTVILGQLRHVEKDSVVLGKFLKKNQKKISSQEFWGVISVYGQCERFYKSDLYPVWESPSPYVYRRSDDFKSRYYFSETLLSPIYTLDATTIQNTPLDTASKRILNDVLRDRVIHYENTVKERRQEAAVNISLNVLSVILQIMLSGGGQSSSSSSYHHTPASTGPRK